MSSATVTFTGVKELKAIFAQFPENAYRKPLNAAFRKAAVPVRSAMISNLPANLSAIRKMIKAKSSRASKGEPSLAVGVFSSGGQYVNSRGQRWNPWVLVYWHNYGTLANRLASHNFSTPRKSKTATWRGGIKPGLFIEKGWEQSQGQAQKIFEESVDQEIVKFFDKEAAKL